jgi:hypothetical protein
MTTNNQPTADEIGAALTSEEWAALEAVAKQQGYPGAKSNYEHLRDLGLITLRDSDNLCRMLSDGWKVLATREAAGKPTEISAAELVANRDEWAAKKDAGECRLIYKGSWIDGIDGFRDHYIIESGDFGNDYERVDGDTMIQIEWLTPSQPATPQRQPSQRNCGVI